jgi:hypothetical protein
VAAILLEAGEIIVKPFEAGRLAELVREKVNLRNPVASAEKERVGEILHRSVNVVIENWLAKAKESSELNHLLLSDQERTGQFLLILACCCPMS